jgi:AcrR family transcriptional regulator
MPDKSPQERRQARTREAILTAARDLVAEVGADNVSLREIARRVDYSPAGLYEYFDGKDDLLNALCERANRQLAAYLGAIPADLPFEDYMVRLMQQYVAFARENPELFTLMFTHLTIGIDAPPEEIDPNDAYAILYGAVERGIASGDIRPGEGATAFDVAYGFWSLAHGAAMLQVNYVKGFDYDFEAADKLAARAFVRGLRGT